VVPVDWLLAGASGVLLVLSFPKFGHPACAWVALAPLILAIRSGGPGRTSSIRRSFLLTWCAGFVYFAGTLYWIGDVLAQFGDLPRPAALLGMVLAAGYLAIYPSLGMAAFGACLRVFADRGLVFAPAAWVAAEFLRGHALSGFPWVPLGNSQVTVLPVAQLASVVGVYGLSALVALVNAALACHRTQMPPSHFLMRMPSDLAARFWANEFFSRAFGPTDVGPDAIEADLFAGLP